MTGKPPKSQRGAVLIASLVLLVAVTLVSLSSIDTGLLELTMSGNEEARMTAFQKAQAGVDSLVMGEQDHDTYFPIVGAAGDANCTAAKTGQDCDKTSLALPNGFDTAKHWARTERLHPVFGCPPRTFGTSCDQLQVAYFSVESRYADAALRGEQSQVLQGLMRSAIRPNEEVVIRGSEISE